MRPRLASGDHPPIDMYLNVCGRGHSAFKAQPAAQPSVHQHGYGCGPRWYGGRRFAVILPMVSSIE